MVLLKSEGYGSLSIPGPRFMLLLVKPVMVGGDARASNDVFHDGGRYGGVDAGAKDMLCCAGYLRVQRSCCC